MTEFKFHYSVIADFLSSCFVLSRAFRCSENKRPKMDRCEPYGHEQTDIRTDAKINKKNDIKLHAKRESQACQIFRFFCKSSARLKCQTRQWTLDKWMKFPIFYEFLSQGIHWNRQPHHRIIRLFISFSEKRRFSCGENLWQRTKHAKLIIYLTSISLNRFRRLNANQIHTRQTREWIGACVVHFTRQPMKISLIVFHAKAIN